MEKFKVVVWCCDDEGFFGGSPEVIGSDFASWDAAAKAGAEYCEQVPFRYRIEQDDPD